MGATEPSPEEIEARVLEALEADQALGLERDLGDEGNPNLAALAAELGDEQVWRALARLRAREAIT